MALTDKLTAIGNAIRAKTGGSSLIPLSDMPSEIAGIVSGVPVETRSYSQMNEKTALFLANVTYDPADYTNSSVGTYAVETAYRKDRPAGVAISIPAAGRLTVQDGSRAFSAAVTAGSYTVCNLTPGHTCTYTLRNSSDGIIAAGTLKPSGVLRMIDGGGNTFNIRDLGGWTCDGGSLKYGLVFRGCELNDNNSGLAIDLTLEQISMFRDFLDIRDEIDLRGNIGIDNELNGDDDIPGTADDITASALGNGVGYALFRINGYGANNNTQKARYAGAIDRVIEDSVKAHACYVHCVEGADRTGTICALIEGLCGVSQSDIDKDYELTTMCGRTRVRTNNSWTTFINLITAMPGTYFRDKVVAYVLQLGVTIENINALRRALIDGTPSDVSSPFSAVTLTASLTNVTSSNTTAPRLYEPFVTTLSPSTGYQSVADVSVTMGGVNITSTCYSNGTISIPRVTGDITITALAVAAYTNLIPTSTVSGGGSVYNGTGYKDGAYVSGAGDGSDSAFTATGYIQYAVPASGLPPAIYVKGSDWSSASHTRLSFYKSNYDFISTVNSTGSSGFGGRFTKESLGTNYFKLTPVASGSTSKLYEDANDVGFFRMSLEGSGSDLIIAFEPIS